MKDNEKEIHKTTLVLKSPSGHRAETSTVSTSGDSAVDKIESIHTTLLAAIKIITIATLGDDEISEDFFASYHNYTSILHKIDQLKILPSDFPRSEERFNENAPDCWMKLILSIFSALYALPGNGKIYCDILVSSIAENNAERNPEGVYLSSSINLEAYDWKNHKVDLYIPNKGGGRMLFLVDDVPMLYTLLPPSK